MLTQTQRKNVPWISVLATLAYLFYYHHFSKTGITHQWSNKRIRRDLHHTYDNRYKVRYPSHTVGSLFKFGFQKTNVENICPKSGEGITVLILVQATPYKSERRTVIRRTYADNDFPDVKVAFIMGQAAHSKVMRDVEEENQIFGDIIVANFKDIYQNLTLKTLSTLFWAAEFCYKAKYVMKTDEDVYINVTNLLASIKSLNNQDGVILGRRHPRPIVRRDKASKYYVPYNQWNESWFPPYVLGMGYVIPVADTEMIIREALNSTFVYMEDAFFTGILAKTLNLRLHNDSKFMHFKKMTCETKFNAVMHLQKKVGFLYTLKGFENSPFCSKSRSNQTKVR